MNRLSLVVLAALAVGVIGDLNCTSSCPSYSYCTSIKNVTKHTEFLNNSLSCSAEDDAKLGAVFASMNNCEMKKAAIELADLMGISWDGVSSIEAIIEDETFWMEKCGFGFLGAAACMYVSVPNKGTCTNGPSTSRQELFCPGVCMQMAGECFNLKEFKQLTESITSFCTSVTTSDSNSTTCYDEQFSQLDPSPVKPSCVAVTATVSLLGPYVVGAVGLALAVVALIGLALITCRKGDAGVPNSF